MFPSAVQSVSFWYKLVWTYTDLCYWSVCMAGLAAAADIKHSDAVDANTSRKLSRFFVYH